MATTVISSLSIGGGHGVTNYTTVMAWWAAVPADFQSADEFHILQFYNDFSSNELLEGTLTFLDKNCDTTRSWRIEPAPGEEHNLDFVNSLKFGSNSVSTLIENRCPGAIIDGVNLHQKIGSGSFGIAVISFAGSTVDWTMRNSIMQTQMTASHDNGIQNAGNLNLYTTIVFGFGSAYRGDTGSGAHNILSNCIFESAYSAVRFRSGTTAEIYNSYLDARNGDASSDDTSGGLTGSNCASSETSATLLSIGTIVNLAPATAFVDHANEDFHIAIASALHEEGIDKSSLYTEDAEGDTWNTVWSIGVDEPDPPSAGQTFTLTALVGAFSVTGNDSILAKTAVCNASTGNFLFDGKDSILSKTSVSKTVTGAFTLTGIDSILAKTSVSQCLPGSFSFNGNDSILAKTSVSKCVTGTFDFTGIDADLIHTTAALTYKITAEVGVFNVSGNDAVLKKNSVSKCVTGAFALTGLDAILIKESIAHLETGSFIFTGNSAILKHTAPGSYKIFATPGVFTVAGNDAVLKKQSIAHLETGNYAVTGLDSILAKTSVCKAVTGAFALTGFDANLIYSPVGSFKITALTGAFNYTGYPADLRYSPVITHKLTAETGVFTYTGNPANLIYSFNGAFTPDTVYIQGQNKPTYMKGNNPHNYVK